MTPSLVEIVAPLALMAGAVGACAGAAVGCVWFIVKLLRGRA